MAFAVKELVVVSGKGGTGKTSITGALSAIFARKVLADCDVDAANLHLIVGGTMVESGPFESGWEVVSDIHKCLQCETCGDLCRFGAIENGVITEPLRCEGCGVCADHCPAGVLSMKKRNAGEWLVLDTSKGSMVSANLGVAIENSGKLVSKVKEIARKIAMEKELKLVLVDGPPGIGCPAIAAITGAALVLAVVEPTVSALHDLIRLQELTSHFRLPLCVCINKSDLHEGVKQQIKTWCDEKSVTVAGEIPYREEFRQALREGRTVMDGSDSLVKNSMAELWLNLSIALQTKK